MVKVQSLTTDVLRNPALEADILAAVLNDPALIDDVEEILIPGCFTDPGHRRLWELMLSVNRRGLSLEPNALAAFISSSELDIDNPGEYLDNLCRNAIPTANVQLLARNLKENYMRRCLASTVSQLQERVFSNHDQNSADEIIEFTEQALYDIAQGAAHESRSKTLAALIDAHESAEDAVFTTSSFSGLDNIIAGFRPQDLVILAARPGVGKTAIALNFIMNIVLNSDGGDRQKTSVFFSLEMSAEQLTQRVIARNAPVALAKLRRDRKGELLTPEETYRIACFVERARECALVIDDEPYLTPLRIRQVLRRLIRQGKKLDVVVIDYLQLMVSDRHQQNRVQEISSISRALKLIAKELDVPIIAISQLSRAVENRDPPVPQLSDLRDSGSIEQDADVVILLYRRDMYLRRQLFQRSDESDSRYEERTALTRKKMEELAGLVTVMVEKNRHGAPGQFTLKFVADTVSFEADIKHDDSFRQALGLDRYYVPSGDVPS